MLSMKTLIPVTFVCAGLVACGSNPAPGSGSSTSSPVSSDNSGMPGGGGDNNGDNNGDNGDHGGGDRGCDLECPDGLVGGHITVDLSEKDQTVKLDGDGSVKLVNASTPIMKTDWDSDGTDIDLIIVHDGKKRTHHFVRVDCRIASISRACYMGAQVVRIPTLWATKNRLKIQVFDDA